MEYRAVGNRCAVNIDNLKLTIPHSKILSVLSQKGFRVVEIDLVALARRCTGVSRYRRGAKPNEAPAVVDCSSFVKWLFGQRGIWLPRRTIQQKEMGQAVELDEIVGGDVIFTTGLTNYYHDDPNDGVGHVGIATDDKTVIHAANTKLGVTESRRGKFTTKENFRGARRYIPKGGKVITFEVPAERCVETADDIKWIVLQTAY